MNDFFEDLKIPGGKILAWGMVVIILAFIPVSFFLDSNILSKSVKIFAVLFDIVWIYMMLWIFKRRMSEKYSNVIIAISVLVVGVTMMTFL